MIQVDSSSPRKSARGMSVINFLTVFEERLSSQLRKATYCTLHPLLENIRIPPLPHLLLLLIALLSSRQDSDCFALERLMRYHHPRYSVSLMSLLQSYHHQRLSRPLQIFCRVLISRRYQYHSSLFSTHVLSSLSQYLLQKVSERPRSLLLVAWGMV